MDLENIVEEAKSKNGLSQAGLAKKLGITPQNMSAVLHRRRALPAEAAIELAELTGKPAKRVWEAAKDYAARAAVVVLACGSLFFSGVEKAEASQPLMTGATPVIQIIAFSSGGCVPWRSACGAVS
jgi:transcriptional regulator with XRE-family HTH domain